MYTQNLAKLCPASFKKDTTGLAWYVLRIIMYVLLPVGALQPCQ